MQQLEFVAGGAFKSVQPLWETAWHYLTKVICTYGPETKQFYSGKIVLPKEMNIHVHQESHERMYIAVLA